jgi:Gpi18-like mannosyltransferase
MTLALNLKMLKDDKWNKLGECLENQTHFHKCEKMKPNIFKWISSLEVGVSWCLNFWNKL